MNFIGLCRSVGENMEDAREEAGKRQEESGTMSGKEQKLEEGLGLAVMDLGSIFL